MVKSYHNLHTPPSRCIANRPRAVAIALPIHSVSFYKLVMVAFVAMAALLLFVSSALAQAGNALDLPEANLLYAELMDNPTDRDLNLRYSALMSKSGDFEAAIPPLERLLVTEPNNAWLMLQLGVLYNALDSRTMAHAYLTQALAEPSIKSDVKMKVQNLLNTL